MRPPARLGVVEGLGQEEGSQLIMERAKLGDIVPTLVLGPGALQVFLGAVLPSLLVSKGN